MKEFNKSAKEKNKVQQLIDELVEKYNIRSFILEEEQWFAINDLPIGERNLRNYKKAVKEANKEFYDTNIKLFNAVNFRGENFFLSENSSTKPFINFDFNTLNNYGETFVKFELFNLIINTSNLGWEYKIGVGHIINEIRKDGFYVDENLTKENFEKLVKRIDTLRSQIVDGNGGYEANQYKKLEEIAKEWTKTKGVRITQEMLIELLKDKKWINGNTISKKALYGNKIMYRNGIYYLSPQGHDLLLTHFNKINDEELIKWSKEHLEEATPF